MAETSSDEGDGAAAESPLLRGRRAILETHRWLVFVLPLAVYMAVGAAEPYGYYPLVYAIKIALAVGAIALVWPGIREIPGRVTLLGILVGAAGIVVWIGLCELHLEQRWLLPLGLGRLVDLGVRPGFSPFHEFRDGPVWLGWAFLAVRLFGLIAVVPLVEELFLRGFLMRFVMQAEWWKVPFGRINVAAVLAMLAYAVLSHPAEMVAAAAWFSLVTLLMVKTRSFWDCVAAHAVTNLLLGAYVVGFHQWQYW